MGNMKIHHLQVFIASLLALGGYVCLSLLFVLLDDNCILLQRYQSLLDLSTPHLTYRWVCLSICETLSAHYCSPQVFTFLVLVLFMARVLIMQVSML